MRALAAQGADGIGLSRTAPASPGHSVCADLVTDPLDRLLADLRPDTILHCAGKTQAPETAAGRAALTAANLTATARLIEAAARLPHPVRLVVVSSAAIYAPMAEGLSAIREDHPMRPVSAYGDSKAAATRHALGEAGRLGLDLAVAVPFNVTGPGQPAHLVPHLFAAQLRAEPSGFALSNAQAVRDWVDVRDVAAALLALGEPDGPRGMFNLSTGVGHSLREVLEALCRVGGWQPAIREGVPHKPSGVSRSIGDPARLRAATGWVAQIPLQDGLRDMLGDAGC